MSEAKTRKKGIIRWGAIGPVTILILLIWAYFFFLFDGHVRHLLEKVGTNANGAEVDIARVRTSFWHASLEIDGIQVTSATEPTHNKLQVGSMHWQMLWDALLRGKAVISDASIHNIAVGVPRARPGRVLPPPPPPKAGKESQVTKLEDEALARAQAEFQHNVLGDAASLLKGADPAAELKNVEGSLKSSARIKELQTQLASKEKEWNDRLAHLPQQKELQSLQDRIKSVKVDHFNSPQEVQQSIQQLDAIYKDVNQRIAEVQSTQQALTTDLATYQNALKDLQTLVDQDVKDLENRVKLPRLDVQTLSRTLFGPTVLTKIQQAQFYLRKAREYMPAKGAKKKTEPTPHERENGRNYAFGRPHSYPLFWLKHAAIDSKSTAGADFSGDLTGAIDNVTTDQELTGEPTTASFKGDFPKQQFFGIDGKLTFDHREETPIERMDLKVAKFPVADRALVDSPDAKLALTNATGHASAVAQIKGDELEISSLSSFDGGAGTLVTSSATQPVLAEILKNATATIKTVDLKAVITGRWSDPKFEIDSNLGRDLASAFEKQLQAKVAEAKAKLQAYVNEQIGKQKDQLTAEFNKQKSQIDGLLKQKEDEVNKEKGSIDQAKNDAIKNQQKQLQQQGGKAVEDLKKKFGF